MHSSTNNPNEMTPLEAEISRLLIQARLANEQYLVEIEERWVEIAELEEEVLRQYNLIKVFKEEINRLMESKGHFIELSSLQIMIEVVRIKIEDLEMEIEEIEVEIEEIYQQMI